MSEHTVSDQIETFEVEPEPPSSPKKLLHVQVRGDNVTQEQLEETLRNFQLLLNDPHGGAIATSENVNVHLIETTDAISGAILTPTLSVENIAYVAHSVVRSYSEALGETQTSHWESLSDEEKRSAVAGVVVALRYNLTPEQQHESWRLSKIADGWKFGPVKNAEQKEHPNLVPYAELPEAQKIKDVLFQSVVRSLRWKLPVPKSDNVVKVVRIAQKSGDEDKEVKFLELRAGDMFSLNGEKFIAATDPYINYLKAWPEWSIDVNRADDAPAQEVAPDDVKATAAQEGKDEQTGTQNEVAQPQS
jgi:hypothetical protein